MKNFEMDDAAYNGLLGALNNLHFAEKRGNLSDFAFFHHDDWLSDTAVVERVHRAKGEWAIGLVFAYVANPLRFIHRQITSYSCPKKAHTAAQLMRRLAAKDQRGTQQVHLHQLNISVN